MRFSYVRFKPGNEFAKYFEQDKNGYGFVGKTMDSFASANSLTSDVWDLTQSGASLLMTHKKHGCTYACPWADVGVALVEPEAAKPAAKGKAAAQ